MGTTAARHDNENPPEKPVPVAMRMGCFFGMFLYGVSFVSYGVILAVLVGVSWVDGHASMGWSATQGTILESSVITHRRERTGGGRGPGYVYSYRLRIEYSYFVNGSALRGNRVYFSHADRVLSRRWAETKVSQYPVGKQVTVYYDPADPNQCSLEVGTSWEDVFKGAGKAFLLLAFGLVGLWVAYLFWKMGADKGIPPDSKT